MGSHLNLAQKSTALEQSRRVITAWDMIEFFGYDFIVLLSKLEWAGYDAKESVRQHGPQSTMPKQNQDEVYGVLVDLEAHCKRLRFNGALVSITHAKYRMRDMPGGVLCAVAESELSGVRHTIQNELYQKHFAYIPPDKAGFFQQSALFGKTVNKAFPSAAPHIRDAGNCLASHLHTAAVFHLIIASEYGLRALARRLHAKTRRPMEFSDWGRVTVAIHEKLQSSHSPKSAKGNDMFVFYHKSLDACLYLKDVWRNNIFHARQISDEGGALKVFATAKQFMEDLAAMGFKETPKRVTT